MKALAISCAALSLWIHLVLAPAHLQEQTYIGVGFLVCSGLLAVAMYGIIRDNKRGWQLGAATCGGACLLLLLSRTTGLYHYKEGWEPEALTVFVVQLAFLIAYFAHTRKEVRV